MRKIAASILTAALRPLGRGGDRSFARIMPARSSSQLWRFQPLLFVAEPRNPPSSALEIFGFNALFGNYGDASPLPDATPPSTDTMPQGFWLGNTVDSVAFGVGGPYVGSNGSAEPVSRSVAAETDLTGTSAPDAMPVTSVTGNLILEGDTPAAIPQPASAPAARAEVGTGSAVTGETNTTGNSEGRVESQGPSVKPQTPEGNPPAFAPSSQSNNGTAFRRMSAQDREQPSGSAGGFTSGEASAPTISVTALDPTAAASRDKVNDVSHDSISTGLFVIQRDGDTSEPLTISFKVQGTAVRGKDYDLTEGGSGSPLEGDQVTLALQRKVVDFEYTLPIARQIMGSLHMTSKFSKVL